MIRGYYVCPTCGSTDLIWYDATASWDEDEGKFVLEQVVDEDNAWCNDCGGRTYPDFKTRSEDAR